MAAPNEQLILIKNNEPRKYRLAFYDPSEVKRSKEQADVPIPRYVDLLPGLNQPKLSEWEFATKGNKVCEFHIQEGTFQVIEVDSTGNPLLKKSEKIAIGLVKQTFDRVLLRRWRNGETRDNVIMAIDTQIQDLTSKPTGTSN